MVVWGWHAHNRREGVVWGVDRSGHAFESASSAHPSNSGAGKSAPAVGNWWRQRREVTRAGGGSEKQTSCIGRWGARGGAE